MVRATPATAADNILCLQLAHDAVHGAGAKWNVALHAKTGFGYGPPTTQACIRALTASGKTSVYYFVTQHPGAEAEVLRSKLGADWEAVKSKKSSPFGAGVSWKKVAQQTAQKIDEYVAEQLEKECYQPLKLSTRAKHNDFF